jgi:putative FmdB family regulatory protein
MPVYEYWCEPCGQDFSVMRPMAEAAQPHACPDCGVPAPRAMLSAPAFAGMPAGLRAAHATNERSRHEPRSSAALERKGHGPGCSCCGSGAKSSRVVQSADGKKAFPTKRPWMISH